MIEVKGDDRDNTDSRQKVKIGRAWQNKAGDGYRYYMVFKDRKFDEEGAYHLDEFMKIVKEL
ncbi:MAG: hypothetical protein FWF96_00610 [Kiritimatiellaeota bacterium]|nr:hypothetical protein [Kiritimatiellota bacterium]